MVFVYRKVVIMSEEPLNKLSNLAQIFCDEARATIDGDRATVELRCLYRHTNMRSVKAAVEFLGQLASQGWVKDFEDVSAMRRDAILRSSEPVSIARDITVYNGGNAAVTSVTMPADLARDINAEASFDF